MATPAPIPPRPDSNDSSRDPLRGLSPADLLAAGLATEPPGGAEAGPPPPTPAQLAPEFPTLDILELLGRGGMGAVYKARQRDLDRFVALKILRPGLDADPGFAERFAREARALAQLNHPGIVTLYEFGRSSAGRYFILMEFVDGVNLRQLLAAGRLAPREALAIVPPLCDALQYAHDRGLVHRDIKPENILVDRLGRVKIADFGIARLASAEGVDGPPGRPSDITLTSAGQTVGTPAYMAPEQRSAPGAVDHRADLYALGVVFYQMLTGELPSPGQLQPPSRRVQLDVRLDEIVLRALEADPARRYAAASEIKTKVETLAASSPVPSAASAVTSDPVIARASLRAKWALALLLALVLGVGAAYHYGKIGASPAPAAWNLDVVVTDQRTWPPKTLKPDRSLPIAGAALALLGSCENRETMDAADWRAAEAAPHLRLEYPRASEGKMPDVILVPFPPDAGAIWTRKAGAITRHEKFSTEKAAALAKELGGDTASAAPRFRFDDRTRGITLLRSHPVAYDFDTEAFIDYAATPQSPHGIEMSLSWHAQKGTDVFADPNSAKPGLLFLGTDLAQAPPSLWDASADEAASYFGRPHEGLMTFIAASDVGREPVTGVYRTAQGGVILVQLLGATDAGDVRLRYKTILPAEKKETPRLLRFDRAGNTMQTIVERLRREQGLRVSFENLDFTPADALTARRIIAAAERRPPASEQEKQRLELARHAENPDALLDVGERYSGAVEGAGVAELLERLTAGTPYLARKLGAMWLIQPRATSCLAFPVTLKTAGLAVDEVARAILAQSPGGHPIGFGMVMAMPTAPGLDATPWLSVRAPELVFEHTPADEALCRLVENARPASVWELAGYRDARMLNLASATADEALAAVAAGQAWLRLIDEGGHAESWRVASEAFRAAVTEQNWVASLAAARLPLGAAKTRRLRSAAATELPRLPPGRYCVMVFDSEFERRAMATETLVFAAESDGAWRSIGYFIK